MHLLLMKSEQDNEKQNLRNIFPTIFRLSLLPPAVQGDGNGALGSSAHVVSAAAQPRSLPSMGDPSIGTSPAGVLPMGSSSVLSSPEGASHGLTAPLGTPCSPLPLPLPQSLFSLLYSVIPEHCHCWPWLHPRASGIDSLGYGGGSWQLLTKPPLLPGAAVQPQCSPSAAPHPACLCRDGRGWPGRGPG